jgi:hypothetical protein
MDWRRHAPAAGTKAVASHERLRCCQSARLIREPTELGVEGLECSVGLKPGKLVQRPAPTGRNGGRESRITEWGGWCARWGRHIAFPQGKKAAATSRGECRDVPRHQSSRGKCQCRNDPHGLLLGPACDGPGG